MKYTMLFTRAAATKQPVVKLSHFLTLIMKTYATKRTKMLQLIALITQRCYSIRKHLDQSFRVSASNHEWHTHKKFNTCPRPENHSRKLF